MLKLVCFVYLIHLVCLVQPNKRDKQNKPNNGLLLLAGFFSILKKRPALLWNTETAIRTG